MRWQHPTDSESPTAPPLPDLSRMTPVEAMAVNRHFCQSLLSDDEKTADNMQEILGEKLALLVGTDKKLDRLFATIGKFACAVDGDEINHFNRRTVYLGDAWKVIGSAKQSHHVHVRAFATGLEQAIHETLPHGHRLEVSAQFFDRLNRTTTASGRPRGR